MARTNGGSANFLGKKSYSTCATRQKIILQLCSRAVAHERRDACKATKATTRPLNHKTNTRPAPLQDNTLHGNIRPKSCHMQPPGAPLRWSSANVGSKAPLRHAPGGLRGPHTSQSPLLRHAAHSLEHANQLRHCDEKRGLGWGVTKFKDFLETCCRPKKLLKWWLLATLAFSNFVFRCHF